MHIKTYQKLVIAVQAMADGLTFKEIAAYRFNGTYRTVEYLTKVGRREYGAVSNEMLIAVFFRKGLIQ